MNSKIRRRLRPLGIDSLPRPVDTGTQLAMEAYFSWRMPDGCDFMAEEWDQLVILDGCRFDMFERQNWLDGELSSRISVATETPEFLERIFGDKTYHDTVYVTANPMHRVDDWCPVDLDDVFRDVIDVWETEWDDELGTLPPEAMVEATEAAHEQYPDCRIIAHFVQPHYPFIGPLGERLEHGRMNGKERAEGKSGTADEKPVWGALRDGDYSTGRVKQAYEENLWLVLPYVQDLIDGFDGTTVVTADHGNHVGELIAPFPVRLFGHPPGIRTPELVRVPWLTVTNEQSSSQASAGAAATAAATDATPADPTPVSSTDGGQSVPDRSSPETSPRPRLREGPLVSVVIPTYYRNEQLVTAIESVRNQRYSPVEIIVVDDSGVGNARPVAEGDDVAYVEHDTQRGANRARTTGIEAASGRYVQLLDDDDRLHPEKFARQVPVLERDAATGVVYSGYLSDERRRLPDSELSGSVLEETLQFGPKACTNSTMLISASVLDDLLPLKDREGADDIGLCIELAMRCEFESVVEALVYKGTTGAQRSAKPAVGRELLHIVDEYSALYADADPAIRRTALRKAYATLGRNTLHEEGWSLSAVSALANSVQYTDERRLTDYGLPVAALFGSPGFRIASTLNARLRG